MKLYNTLTRKKEEFVPINAKEVKMYCCGPTVYDYPHIGNLRTYIFEDLLKRTLLFNGYKVKHVVNITDVGHLTSDSDTGEDKLELGAEREGKTAKEISKFYTDVFKKNIASLNILEPDIWCKATDHIKEMIDWIKKLEKKGFTYTIENDGIYFDTSKFANYGELARLKKEKLKAGARIEIAEGKKNITDFALWKFSPKDKKRQQEWVSPWGVGFPGWHIECSVMSTKYLGEQFDIHCGGIDHIPIHHTNEIAQTEAVTGKKWVNYWCHAEFLVMKDVKMSKSKGNFITLDSVSEEGYDPMAYRYLCLISHYKKPLTFSIESVKNAEISYVKLKEKIAEFLKDNKKGGSASEYLMEFSGHVGNDLDMPKALAVVWNLVKDKEIGGKIKYDALIKMDEVLGLNLKHIKVEKKLRKELQKIIEEREQARKNKDWAKSDELRNKLLEKGVIVEDTKEGVKWKYAMPPE